MQCHVTISTRIGYVCRFQSSVIIIGAIISASDLISQSGFELSGILGLLAIFLAAINIFGGFLVTQRMLQMYKKKKRGKQK